MLIRWFSMRYCYLISNFCMRCDSWIYIVWDMKVDSKILYEIWLLSVWNKKLDKCMRYDNGPTLVRHHISYNAYLIHSTIISHTFYNQLIYLIQKHKLRVQYLIHFLLIRKSRIISHTIKVNSTFILHTLQIRAKCWFRRSWRSLWWWTPNSLVDGIIGMTKCRWSWEPAVLLWSEEAETKQQCGQTTSPNCIRFQSSVRLG